MSSVLRAPALCFAVLGLVAVAGCGGGDTQSKNDYVAAINKAQTDFVESVQKATPAPRSAGSDPVATARGTFANIDKAIGAVISDLEAVEPPDEVKRLHQDLIEAMDDLKAEVAKAGDSLGSRDPARLSAAQSDFAKNATELQTRFAKTIGAINTKLQD